jgi:hypothetical protein
VANVWVIIALILISSAVGAIAKVLNNLAEQQAARRAVQEREARAERMRQAAERARASEDERAERPKAAPAAREPEHAGGAVKPATSDMDRFLAEIDKLRRKAALAAPPPAAGSSAPVAPVVQPIKPPADKPKRAVAEYADAPPAAAAPPPLPSGFSSPHGPARAAPEAAQVEQLPVAPVVRTPSATGAAATKVTKLPTRARPASKTNFGKNLTALLASGQGVALAVVMQEILGPPKAKKNAKAEPQA